jgi:hypothetical protein
MIRPSQQLAALGVVLGAFFAVPAIADAPHADPSKPANAKQADKVEKAKDKAEARADKAEAKADKAEAKADKAVERAEKASEKDQQPGARGAAFRNEIRDLREELKTGKVKKEQVKDRLAKLEETRKEREQRHREALKERWGDRLAEPAVVQELQHHERRMAMLDRMLLLTETERTGKDREKLVQRVEKLIEKENSRHEKKMTELKTSTPAPANQAPVGATPAAGATPAPANVNVKGTTEAPAGGVK